MGLDHTVSIVLGVKEPEHKCKERTQIVFVVERVCSNNHVAPLGTSWGFCQKCGKGITERKTATPSATHPFEFYPGGHNGHVFQVHGEPDGGVVLGICLKRVNPKHENPGIWDVAPDEDDETRCKAYLDSIGLGYLTPTLYLVSETR